MLVDDHEVVRGGVRALLEAADDVVVCGEAASAREAVAERGPPRRGGDGRQAAGRQRRRGHPRDPRRPPADPGADAHLLRRRRGAARLHHGRRDGVRPQADQGQRPGPGHPDRSGRRTLKDEKLARLSPQEERILSLVAAGRTNRQVGEELHLAEKTVKNYVSSILTKLEVARRAEAAAYLARHGTPPPA
jgi:two-component system response regulator DevR